MDTIVSAARSQIKALDARRDKLLRIIELAESLDGITEPMVPAAKQEQERAPGVRQRTAVTLRTREAVRSLLGERGTPVRLRDLLSEVRRRDIPVGGKNEVATLAARLSNADEFRSIPGKGWWFAGKPDPGSLSVFEEPEGGPATETPSDSNNYNGGSHGTPLAD